MCPTLASRVTYVGELGWEFYCPMEYGLRLWDTLWEAGQPEGMVAAGYKAIDSLRLEKGYRYWSSEISPDYTPLEAGLGFAVKLNKAEFIGKEALLEQKKTGIKAQIMLPDPLRQPNDCPGQGTHPYQRWQDHRLGGCRWIWLLGGKKHHLRLPADRICQCRHRI